MKSGRHDEHQEQWWMDFSFVGNWLKINPSVPRVQKIKIRNLTLNRLLIVELLRKTVYLGASGTNGLSKFFLLSFETFVSKICTHEQETCIKEMYYSDKMWQMCCSDKKWQMYYSGKMWQLYYSDKMWQNVLYWQKVTNVL